MATLHIGTSGWNYRHWRGVLYPRGLKPADWLAHYARTFGTVEINTTFYGQPSAATLARWLYRTPASFTFAVKMSRFVTHAGGLEPSARSLERFESVADAFGDRLAAVLIQLPPSLPFEAARVGAFLDRLQPRRYALEARHPSWFARPAMRLLASRGVAWCIASSGALPRVTAVTSDFVYLRFHGPGTTSDAGYPERFLAATARSIDAWRARGLDVLGYFNNDGGGHAVHDARRLAALSEPAVTPALRTEWPAPGEHADLFLGRLDDGGQSVPHPGR